MSKDKCPAPPQAIVNPLTPQAIALTVSNMRSSVSTATAPSKKPVSRSFVLKAETQEVVRHDTENDHFFWAYTEEPHRTRRMAIIKAHPEVF